MMTEERVREYQAETVKDIKRAIERGNRYDWTLRCEKLWTLDFVLEDFSKSGYIDGYIHPEDRFPFVPKTQEAAR